MSCSKYLDENAVSRKKSDDISTTAEGQAGKNKSKVRIIPIQIAKDHPTAVGATERKPAMTSSDDVTTSSSMTSPPPIVFSRGSGYGSLPRRFQKKQVRSLIVPKMRRMFEKSRSAEPEVAPHSRKIKISLQQSDETGSCDGDNNGKKGTIRGDGTESVSSFVVVDQPHYPTAPAAAAADDIDDDEEAVDNTSVSEWSFSDEQQQTSDGNGSNGGQRGFVNRCVSKVKSLVKQGSPQPQ